MFTCPYCEWPFALKTELAVHIQIKHKGALSLLLQHIQDEAKYADTDELLDDGVYTGDTVIHEPYDDDEDEYDYTEGDIGQDGEI